MDTNALGYDSTDIEMSAAEAIKEIEKQQDFLEDGIRACMVAAGPGGVLFSTMGLSNAFGFFQEY